MHPKLHRTFPSREHFAENFVRRLSERGIEFKLTGQEAPPAGTVLELDLRLEDGRPLIVGTGEVTSGGSESGTFRLRFLELTQESRKGLDELILLAAATSDQAPAEGTTTSIRDLVEGVYGEAPPSAALENSAVLIPPDPSGGRPTGARAPAPKTPEKRPSFFRRLQVSPGVIVVAIIAGATGAAANAWFHDLADLFIELAGSETAMSASPVIDEMPTDVAPSDFSAEETTAPGPVAEQTVADGGARPAAEQADAGPLLSGSAGGDGSAPAVGGAAGASSRPADRIRVITWDEYAAETVVTFFGNGTFPPERVLRRRVSGGRPRELIKLRGIDLPFRETVIPVQTPELERIRTGFHPQDRINELHVVLDLAGPNVQLDRIEREETSLRLHLRTTAGQGTDRATGSAAD